MILLAYFPPIWRRVMDPKVRAHYAGDLSLANVQPTKRRKYGLRLTAREQLLDAVDALLAERTWAKLSMGEVARRAGLSRQTLYNEFGSRTEFAEAMVMREAERLLAGPERALADHAGRPARRRRRRRCASFLEAAADNRLVEAMLAEADDGLLAVVTTRGAVLRAATDRLTTVVVDTYPGSTATAPLGCARSSSASASATPPCRAATRRDTAAAVAAVLGPHLDELLLSEPSRAA